LLEFGGAPAEDEVAEPFGRRAQLSDQAGLADPLLSGYLDEPLSSGLKTGKCLLQDAELGAPPYEDAGSFHHTSTLLPGSPHRSPEIADEFRD
jgi:hypothetical protein